MVRKIKNTNINRLKGGLKKSCSIIAVSSATSWGLPFLPRGKYR